MVALLDATAAADKRRPPPRPRLGPIPAGDGWSCYALEKDGARHSGCYRSETRCRHMAGHLATTFDLPTPKCQSEPSAAVYTSFDVKAKRTLYQAYTSMRECEQGRRGPRSPGEQIGSPCEEVKATEGSRFEKGLIPAGRGWWCATTATGGVSSAWCKREQKDCLAQVSELTDGGGTVSAACRQAREAFATTWDDVGGAKWLVAPTLEDCLEFTESASGTSRCTRVR